MMKPQPSTPILPFVLAFIATFVVAGHVTFEVMDFGATAIARWLEVSVIAWAFVFLAMFFMAPVLRLLVTRFVPAR